MTSLQTSTSCQFFVQRKKRFCRMTVKNGNRFCGEHLLQSQENDEKEERLDDKSRRISCPVDPTHSCYESRLVQHLKVCNAKKLAESQPSFIVKGINLGNVNEDQPLHTPLRDLDQSVIDAVIKKVEAAHERLPPIDAEVLNEDSLKEELSNELYGHGLRKHLLQNASLLAHLKNSGLDRDNTCFIEFGAGKGKLTYWLARSITNAAGSTVLLVDRSSHRHKNDNKLKNEKCPVNVSRIRADIADLRLSDVPEIQQVENVVGIAKHLCGVATDLTIRCLLGLVRDNPKVRVTGLIIAFCCHHRCQYSAYVGKEYLKSCGFDREEFSILCSIASWATCATGKNRNVNIDDCLEKKEKISERESIGRKVKTLLNWGRIKYLENFGFNSKLVYYTTSDVSLENMGMISVST